MWAQWEQDRSWLDGLLSDTETSTPKMHLAQGSEDELSDRLNVYQVIVFILFIQLCSQFNQNK